MARHSSFGTRRGSIKLYALEPSPVNASAKRPSPRRPGVSYGLRALGRSEMPERFWLEGREYRRTQTIKHDFFAATGLYADAAGNEAILKISRLAEFAGLPMAWAGWFLWQRERQLYRKLRGIPGIPRILGSLPPNGLVLEYVRGTPLTAKPPVPDAFFDELLETMRLIHSRDVAYVDTHKPSNILLGEDGHPHVVDFQISQDLDRIGRGWPQRWLLSRLQADDVYHLLKHKRRLRPDLINDADRLKLHRVSFMVRWHRILAQPYFQLRRRTFRRLRDTGRLLPEGSK